MLCLEMVLDHEKDPGVEVTIIALASDAIEQI